LLKAYEKILTHEIDEQPTAYSASDDIQNLIEQGNLEARRLQRTKAVQKGLEKIDREAKFKQSIGHAMQVALVANEVFSFALKSCPEAALAWSGISLGLQVSLR
jgi:hypothetical protein